MSEEEEEFVNHYTVYIDERLQRYFAKLTTAFAILGVSVGLGFIYIAHVSADNHKGLCATKRDAEDRISQTEKYLQQHPEGFAGISAPVIRRGLDNNKRTVKALESINCG